MGIPSGNKAFDDVAEFHKKFGFTQPDKPGFIATENMYMRLNFLLEELMETANAAGFFWEIQEIPILDADGNHVIDDAGDEVYSHHLVLERDEEEVPDEARDLEAFFDGLIDLNYVSYGFAWLTNLPYPEGWNRVHAANMTKVRCERPEDSKRGTTFDVIKPEGFVKPTLTDLLP